MKTMIDLLTDAACDELVREILDHVAGFDLAGNRVTVEVFKAEKGMTRKLIREGIASRLEHAGQLAADYHDWGLTLKARAEKAEDEVDRLKRLPKVSRCPVCDNWAVVESPHCPECEVKRLKATPDEKERQIQILIREAVTRMTKLEAAESALARVTGEAGVDAVLEARCSCTCYVPCGCALCVNQTTA